LRVRLEGSGALKDGDPGIYSLLLSVMHDLH
jgi:hypothetical protein